MHIFLIASQEKYFSILDKRIFEAEARSFSVPEEWIKSGGLQLL